MGQAARPLRLLLALLVLAVCAAVPCAAEDPGLAVAFVLDTSGSLRPDDEARRAKLAVDLLAHLPEGSAAAVLAFDDQPRLVQPLTTDPALVRKAALGLHRSGQHTALYDAIFDASRYLSKVDARRKAMVVVTDGLDENSALVLEDGVRMAQETAVPVFTVGTGRVQENVLRRISKLTDAEYFGTRANGTEVAARVHALTPEWKKPVPPAEAASSSKALPGTGVPGTAVPAPPPTTLAAPTSDGGASVLASRSLWAAVLMIAAVFTVAVFAVLALMRRRDDPAPSLDPGRRMGLGEADPTAPVRIRVRDDDEDAPETLVMRRPDMENANATMVLALKPLLHITRGPNQGRLFEVRHDMAISVGRSRGNDVTLDDEAVSGQHFRIRPEADGGFELIDLKSTNGTYVNERRVQRHRLAVGDVIKLGETYMQFRLDHQRH